MLRERYVEEEPPWTGWQGSRSEGQGQGWGLSPPPPLGAAGDAWETCHPCPVPQKSHYGWVVVRGWEWVLLNTINLISFFKKKKGKEKSNTCQQRRLWSLTVHRRGCSGDRWGGDTNQVPRELPFLCTRTAESRVTPGIPTLPLAQCPHL